MLPVGAPKFIFIMWLALALTGLGYIIWSHYA